MSDIFSAMKGSDNKNEEHDYEKERQELKIEVQKKLPAYVNQVNLFGATDPVLLKNLEGHIKTIINLRGTTLKNYEIEELVSTLILEITSLGKLTPLIQDPTITEVMINGPQDIWIERKGLLEKTDVTYDNDAQVMELASRIVRNIGRNIDASNPEVDARLPDGSRVHIIIPPIARKGVTITIRKFFKEKLTINDLIQKETLTPEMARFLKALVYSKANVIISGGTGSGKTTTLNIVSNFIPKGERLITIEDSAELQLSNDHVVSMETKNANAEGNGEITIQRLVKASLRMRPDRIIVGEVRDKTAYNLLNAMNTGHEGSMSTVHANDPESCVTRLANLVKEAGLGYTDETVQTLIAQAVDVVVQISRVQGGARRITHISLVDTDDNGQIVIKDIYRYKADLKDSNGENFGAFIRTGEKITSRIKHKMVEAGLSVKKG